MSTTEHQIHGRRKAGATRTVLRVLLCCTALGLAVGLAGCGKNAPASTSSNGSSTEATAPVGSHMSGAAVDVHIAAEAVKNKPKPADLSTPVSAVKSYLEWISYAYRIADSSVAKDVMDPDEMVRVDAYSQYNIQKKRLIEQKLDSFKVGTVVTKGNTATVPAEESWTYSYLSIDTGNARVEGPLQAAYDTVYTVVKSKDGKWRVAKVKATARGTVK